jgi:uncharacterized membrane protein YbhN (UPF0104 family)
VLAGLAGALVMLAGLLAAQRWALPFLVQAVRRLAPGRSGAAAAAQVVRDLHRRPRRLLACLMLHLAAWSATSLGAWLILRFIGRPLPILSVAALEGLLFAVRNAAFMIPAALGVQEGAYALLGPLFGLPPEAALALSLLKRARDVAIGVPVLLSWQAAEFWRSLRRRRVRAGGDAGGVEPAERAG